MRTIARLDIKNEHVIKGIHLEGLRKIGDPYEIALSYYKAGIDEIIFLDAVASLYDRNSLFDLIKKASRNVFVPITIGGGLRSLSDVRKALMSGADKVAVNTAAVKNPALITEIAEEYGSQCIVASIEAKRVENTWEVYIDNGREKTGLNVVEWTQELESLGAGEILLTSIDQEGTKKGFDLELSKIVNQQLSIPIIVSGGCGNTGHYREIYSKVRPNAVAIASLFHYNLCSIDSLKECLDT